MKKYFLKKNDFIKVGEKKLFKIHYYPEWKEKFNINVTGGYIEKEENLSQEGLCIVCDNAKVYTDAKVHGNAQISGNAQIYGEANIYGNAQVYNDARIYGYTILTGESIAKENVSQGIFINKKKKEICYLTAMCGKHVANMQEDKLRIGCEIHPLEYWRKHYKKIGFRSGYTEEKIKMYGEIIKMFYRVLRG